jgi:hypothetical protein
MDDVMVFGFCDDVMLWCKVLTWRMCKIILVVTSIYFYNFSTFINIIVLV